MLTVHACEHGHYINCTSHMAVQVVATLTVAGGIHNWRLLSLNQSHVLLACVTWWSGMFLWSYALVVKPRSPAQVQPCLVVLKLQGAPLPCLVLVQLHSIVLEVVSIWAWYVYVGHDSPYGMCLTTIITLCLPVILWRQCTTLPRARILTIIMLWFPDNHNHPKLAFACVPWRQVYNSSKRHNSHQPLPSSLACCHVSVV